MVIRALLVTAALSACGGSKSSSTDTTPSNTGGTTDTPPTGAADGSSPAGPGDARVIMRKADSGVIELAGNHAGAMEKATAEMAAHCGASNYTITQEGEEAVQPSGGGARTEVAWRVHYQCFAP